MGYKKEEAIRRVLEESDPDMGDKLEEKIAAIHSGFINFMVRHYRESATFSAFPNTEETLRRLRRNDISIGLNTGFPRVIADVIMERVGWIKMGWINFLVTSDEAPHGRPHPDMIFDMMRLAGIEDAGEVTKVGDTEVDIREGQNAGCRYVIGVTTGAFSRPELEKYQPTHIVDDIIDVVPVVMQ